MPRPNITTATVVAACPRCGVTGKQLQRLDHDVTPTAERRMCYACGLGYDVGQPPGMEGH